MLNLGRWRDPDYRRWLRDSWGWRLDYWRWLWNYRVPGTAKVLAAAVPLAAVGITGFAVATTAGGDGVAYVETTVQQVVTVERAGRLVTTRVPVVRTLRERAVTQYVDRTDTVRSTVTTPAGLVVRTTEVQRRVPVVVREVVTGAGRTVTVARTRTATAERVITDTRTQFVTNTRVERETERQTIVNVVTQPVTNVVTDTQTVTQPVTVVETVSVPVTLTETVTVTTKR